MGSPDYKEDWIVRQCCHCRFYIRLEGVFCDDYGACTNPQSDFDGIVRFEHDGCKNCETLVPDGDEGWDP